MICPVLAVNVAPQPSVTVGTLEARSVIEPTRFVTRHKARHVEVYEGEAESIDPVAQTVTFIGMFNGLRS